MIVVVLISLEVLLCCHIHRDVISFRRTSPQCLTVILKCIEYLTFSSLKSRRIRPIHETFNVSETHCSGASEKFSYGVDGLERFVVETGLILGEPKVDLAEARA